MPAKRGGRQKSPLACDRLTGGKAIVVGLSVAQRVIWLTRCLVAIALVAVGAAGGGRAQAAAAYQGIYVVIDPYNLTNITQLQTAAQTTCAQNQKSITTPFCGATNGILLRAAWCNFQLYHVNGPSGKPYPGCHYTTVWPSGASSGHGLQAPDTDTTSPCPGIYDTCTGRTTSVLGKVLHSIVQINAQRSTAGLPPLLLSIGIYAGQGTPQSVFDSQGYVDVPYNYSATTQSTEQCFRLPLEWLPQFVSAYEAAQDQFVSYIKAQMPQGANIVVEKMGAISSNDLEVEMQGPAAPVSSPPDPGPAGPGPLLNCSQTVAPAQVWLNAYNANPTYNMNMSQAIESAFGGTIGHALGTLANNGIKTTLISLATTNGDAFPMVNCGVTGAAVCSVSPQSGNWSVYYMEKYVGDLFNGGLAYTQAQAAYAAIRSDTFSLRANPNIDRLDRAVAHADRLCLTDFLQYEQRDHCGCTSLRARRLAGAGDWRGYRHRLANSHIAGRPVLEQSVRPGAVQRHQRRRNLHRSGNRRCIQQHRAVQSLPRFSFEQDFGGNTGRPHAPTEPRHSTLEPGKIAAGPAPDRAGFLSILIPSNVGIVP